MWQALSLEYGGDLLFGSLGSLLLGSLGVSVSNSWSLGADLFGWVASQYLGVGVPGPGCGRIGVCQPKDGPVSLDLEVSPGYPGVWQSSGSWVFKYGSVFVLCPHVGLSEYLGVWAWGSQVSG